MLQDLWRFMGYVHIRTDGDDGVCMGDLWGIHGEESMGTHGESTCLLWLWSGAHGGDLWATCLYLFMKIYVLDCGDNLLGCMGAPHCYCGFGLGLTGLIYGARIFYFSRFMYGIAVANLRESLGNPDYYRGCGLGPMERVGLRCQTYGDLWRIRIGCGIGPMGWVSLRNEPVGMRTNGN